MTTKTGKKHNPWTFNRWLGVLGLALAFSSLIVEFGFRRPPVPRIHLHLAQVGAAVLLWWSTVTLWLVEQRREFTWRKPVLDITLLVGLAGVLLFRKSLFPESWWTAGGISAGWRIFQVYLLILGLVRLGRISMTAAAWGSAPTRVLLLSFGVIILTGSFLLMLPGSHRGERLGFTDAVFTSTSATCVTGLIVRDTGGDFTRLGQTVILVLIQLGGLGIMIFGAMFALLLGSPLSLRESVAMRDIMNEQTPGRIGRVVVFICLVTFALEAVGMAGMYGMWPAELGMGRRLYKSLFHAISSFCNAGFSLQANSLVDYQGVWQTYMILCPLIVLGGLGFPVLNNLWTILYHRFSRKRQLPAPGEGLTPARLSLHSKIVLVTTGALLVFGFLLFMVLEMSRSDGGGGFSAGRLCLSSVFNSVTARTAGFNTVAIEGLSAGSKLVLIFLMCVGGSPSSTAGGIKTVTFAVMVLTIYATMRRRRVVHAFKRSIPLMLIRRVATLIMLYGLLLWLLTLLLTITEHSGGRNMLDLLFEVASGLGTVGLSTGVTSELTWAGKWVMIVAMFVGRLGPLSLLAALTFNVRPERYEYPREPLVVG